MTAEARKAAKAAQWKQQQADRALVGEAMRKILSDDDATAREKIFAALTLNNIAVGELVPYKAARLYDCEADVDTFRTAVEAIQAEEDITT